MGNIPTKKRTKSHRAIAVCYYIPIALHLHMKQKATERRMTFSECLEEALTKQLMRDFSMLEHINYENIEIKTKSSQILTATLLCERCLLISTENPQVGQIKIGANYYCELCAMWEVREIMHRLLQNNTTKFNIFEKVFDFLSPSFFSELYTQQQADRVDRGVNMSYEPINVNQYLKNKEKPE